MRLALIVVPILTACVALLSAACGGSSSDTPAATREQAAAVETSTLRDDPSLVSANSETNSDGEVTFHDMLSDRDISVRAIDGETRSGVPGISVHFASNGGYALVVAEDPEGRYAPRMFLETYPDLPATTSDLPAFVSNLGSHPSILRTGSTNIVVLVLEAISKIQLGVDAFNLAVDLPTLLTFTLLDSTWCVTPDQLANITGVSVGVVFLFIGGGITSGVAKVVVAASEKVGSILLERGITASVTEPISVKLRHFTFAPVGVGLPVEIVGRCGISGEVFVDANRNGVRDGGEAGYGGATATLSGADTKKASTDGGGKYSLSGFRAGDYTMSLSVPSGYEATTANPVTVNADVTKSTTVNFGIALLPGVPVPGVTPPPNTKPTPTPTPTPKPPTDSDNDGIPDSSDNCPLNYNPSQSNVDGDGAGDACDTQDNRDSDGDGIQNWRDQCPNQAEDYDAYEDADGCPDAGPTPGSPPNPPTNVVDDQMPGGDTATLYWTDNSDNEDGFNVYGMPCGGFTGECGPWSLVASLPPGQTFYYHEYDPDPCCDTVGLAYAVSAFNEYGESAWVEAEVVY